MVEGSWTLATQHHIPEDPNPQLNHCGIFKSCILEQLFGQSCSALSCPSKGSNEPLQATLWKDAFRWETNFNIRTLKKAVMVEKWKTSGELWICWGRSIIRDEHYDKHNDRPLWPNAWIIRPIFNSQVHQYKANFWSVCTYSKLLICMYLQQTSDLYVPTANFWSVCTYSKLLICVYLQQTSDLYVPTANLAMYQKSVYYSGIKIYNHLPTAIKDLSGDKNKFKLAL
jgi:hypothetical protein